MICVSRLKGNHFSAKIHFLMLQTESEVTFKPFIHFKLRKAVLYLAALASIVVTRAFLSGIFECAQQTKANESTSTALAVLPAKTQVDYCRTGSIQLLITKGKITRNDRGLSVFGM
jgi:hypothetical protein